jgi:hypothetical protein
MFIHNLLRPRSKWTNYFHSTDPTTSSPLLLPLIVHPTRR